MIKVLPQSSTIQLPQSSTIQLSEPMPSTTGREPNVIESYPNSIKYLIHTLKNTNYPTPEQIKQIVEKANISPEDLMPWADFNHPIEDSYGRKLVFDGGQFEIMVMSWVPGDFSAIHDHGATQWGAVQCFGAAEHYIYRFEADILYTAQEAHYSPGMVRSVNNSLIHQMGNPTNIPFLSLHVYGAPEAHGTITGNARIFDLLDGSTQYTDGGVFFGLPESKINRRTYGLKGDEETTLRHHQCMSDRFRRILEARPDPELQATLDRLTHSITMV